MNKIAATKSEGVTTSMKTFVSNKNQHSTLPFWITFGMENSVLKHSPMSFLNDLD